MAVPVIETKSSNSSTSGGSLTITAPTSITTGDLLIGSYTSVRPAGSQTANVPAGWTLIKSISTSSTKSTLIAFYKVAVLADESATDYTFTATSADYMQGSILRVSGAPSGTEITVSEADSLPAVNTDTVINHTAALTPQTTDSLVVICAGGIGLSLSAVVTTSAYTSTPTTTWTEQMDLGYRDGASDGSSHAVATAPYTGSTQFTAYGYTTSEAFQEVTSILFMVNSPQNATGTTNLLSVSPTMFAPTASAGTTGTNTLHAVSPTMFAQSGKGQRGTPWTNPNKPATNWDNLPK